MASASQMLMVAYRRAEDAQVHHDFAQEQALICDVHFQIEHEGASSGKDVTSGCGILGFAKVITSWAQQENIRRQRSAAEFAALVREINASTGYKAVCQDWRGRKCLPYVVKTGTEKGEILRT